MPLQIHGIVPILPTAFTSDGQVNWEALPDLIGFAHAAGACAVCLPAYASEFYKLSDEERERLVDEAVHHSAGRIPVIAQVNHPGAVVARAAAKRSQQRGAAAVCVAAPRLFALPEGDLAKYFNSVLGPVELPVIVQDFNPGGSSLSPRFIASLHRAHPQFRYVKLEDPMMAGKVKAIREEAHDEVGVIEGWGGMHMLELLPAGIRAVMPGLALTDLLARVYQFASQGAMETAYTIFQGVLPQIVFSLQSMELFHHAEKRLLQARGVLRSGHVRDCGLQLSSYDEDHVTFLNGRILALLHQLGLPVNPASP